jgi:hypothetical protein
VRRFREKTVKTVVPVELGSGARFEGLIGEKGCPRSHAGRRAAVEEEGRERSRRWCQWDWVVVRGFDEERLHGSHAGSSIGIGYLLKGGRGRNSQNSGSSGTE